MGQPILVGDIGGTNVRFAFADIAPNGLKTLHHIWRAPSRQFPSFGDALSQFLSEHKARLKSSRAVFAIAGPVDSDRVTLTNNPWVMERNELVNQFGFEHLIFMNDFAAMARSVPELPNEAFITLQAGSNDDVLQTDKVLTVAGAGTGLGQAILTCGDNQWSVIPTEGGHQPFAPVSDYETKLLKALQDKVGFVSYEHICSGSGLSLVYQTLCNMTGAEQKHHTPRAITEAAKSGDKISAATCEFASDTLMSFMGNAVLSSGAWDGAVIAGGVSQHLADYLKRPAALTRFREKGKMSQRMTSVPLRLLIDPTAPLIGAASATTQ